MRLGQCGAVVDPVTFLSTAMACVAIWRRGWLNAGGAAIPGGSAGWRGGLRQDQGMVVGVVMVRGGWELVTQGAFSPNE